MATQSHHSRGRSVAAHNQRIDQYVPLERWKALKGLVYALMIAGLAIYATWADADPTTVFLAATAAIIVITSVEVKEVELANALSITFRDRRDDQGEGEE